MAPYFIQNKVIGVNLNRLIANGASESLLKPGGNLISQATFEALIASDLQADNNKPATYKNILDLLHTKYKGKNLALNNYMRDNMMIGSESADGTSFTGKVASVNDAKTQINNFKSVVGDYSRN